MPELSVSRSAQNLYIPSYFVKFIAVMGAHIRIPMKTIGITYVFIQNSEPGNRDPGNRPKAYEIIADLLIKWAIARQAGNPILTTQRQD